MQTCSAAGGGAYAAYVVEWWMADVAMVAGVSFHAAGLPCGSNFLLGHALPVPPHGVHARGLDLRSAH
ncbi:MAG: hypothetical protein KBT18_08315 [Comamonas sp.]|nr:hypothetical protein [Candidatus Comamonas equi]